MAVEGIYWDQAAVFWPQVSVLIAPSLALMDSGYTSADLLVAVQARDKQLWLINHGQAAAITSIQVLPQWKKLIVEYLGGSGLCSWRDEWFAAMQHYAQHHHCKYIEVYGRKGWARLARARGDTTETLQYSRKHV